MRIAERLAACASAVLFAFAVSGAGAVAQQRQTIDVESRFHGKPLTIHAQMFLPASHSDGKIPAMIIVHGSGGVRGEREFAYAREFNPLGIASVVIDSFTPRGIKSTVRNQAPVSSYDMLIDAVHTLNTVAHHPAIDPARIGIIGFSKGGTVAIEAALRRYMDPLAVVKRGFAVLVAMYPWCGNLPLDFHAASGAPLHMLLGEQDRYAGTESCKEFGEKFAAAGGNLTLKIYPGAQHDWDFPGSAHWTDAAGQNTSKCIYDEVCAGHLGRARQPRSRLWKTTGRRRPRKRQRRGA